LRFGKKVGNHGAAMKPYLNLYVAEQARSKAFYAAVLDSEPQLDVPGMTEFVLPTGAVLGLVPEAAIKSLLGPALPDPAQARGIPRAELYLLVEQPADYLARALRHGARELSALAPRAWGHTAAYCLDPDGHVVAFARRTAGA
jgi:catechol 2,3-dioxygenase-like lactoylglutathione lyase family enzyme